MLDLLNECRRYRDYLVNDHGFIRNHPDTTLRAVNHVVVERLIDEGLYGTLDGTDVFTYEQVMQLINMLVTAL